MPILPTPAESSANQTCFTVGNHILKLLINADLVTEYAASPKDRLS